MDFLTAFSKVVSNFIDAMIANAHHNWVSTYVEDMELGVLLAAEVAALNNHPFLICK